MDEQRLSREADQKARQTLANDSVEVEERFRAAVLLRVGTGGIRLIGRRFRIMDDSGNKRLEKDEFKKACQEMGLKFSPDDCDKFFVKLDKDGSGSVDFDEFLAATRTPMSDARKDLIKRAFDKLDRTGDGVATFDDMKGVYNVKEHPKFKNGEWTEQQVFAAYLKSFEAKDSIDGKVTFDEFLDYYSGVSYSIDNDAYFSLMMKNAWKLSDGPSNDDGRKNGKKK